MNLTDRNFWVNYWESKDNLVFEIPPNFILTELLEKIIQQNSIKNALEIGGFPGHYSIVLKKRFGIDATLLDFVIVPKILNDLLKANQLPENSVHFIEADLFDYTPQQQYDLVFSNGLIEHFDDTSLIIAKHLAFLEKNGILFITLPNFKSLNGWFQEKFDPENYAKHNIACMDIDFLKKVCQELGLKNIQVNYYGKFMLWLENEKQKSVLVRLFKKLVWFVGKVFFKLFPFESKYFSPYIIITAQK